MDSDSRLHPSSSVTGAVLSRFSCRAFLTDKPVPSSIVRMLVELSMRAASGGNLQPWKLHVLSGAKLHELVETVSKKFANLEMEVPAYEIYPEEFLRSPAGSSYMQQRRQLAYAMYGLQGISRKDREKRIQSMAQNYKFFGAPVGIILSIDHRMGKPQWCDLGIFIQTLGLLAREHGLHTCYQESWAQYPESCAKVLQLPKEQIVFCGIALGYMDPMKPVNELKSMRFPLSEVAVFDLDEEVEETKIVQEIRSNL
eukprot:g2427.t1